MRIQKIFGSYLSDAVLSHIEGANYADNKSSHKEFLKKNLYVFK